MDPLTQGTVGALFAQTAAKRERLAIAAGIGCLAGMAPDIDVLFRSEADPLLFLEYHRQFTHALAFIPVGALICATIGWLVVNRRIPFREAYLYAFLGYATHGMVDACTTYGTQLLWPFSDMRVAWNNMSIIDPLFTLPLLALVIMALTLKRPAIARTAAVVAVLYAGVGVMQRERAETLGAELAASRDHTPVRLEAKPSFGQLLLWKIVYEAEGRYYVDAVRVGSSTRVYPGDNIAKLDLDRDLPWLEPGSLQARDVERFRWFSNRYLALGDNPNQVIDVRYSMLPNSIDPLWAIELTESEQYDKHVTYVTNRRSSGEQMNLFWRMLRGEPIEGVTDVSQLRPGAGPASRETDLAGVRMD